MSNLILPGLIDTHVHLRDPGQTQKEDFYTGTCAALAGGYTTIIDMPNNKVPITTKERLEEKIAIAKKKIVCDVGFYFGSMGDNLDEFAKVKGKVMGLKLYLNETTGNLTIDQKSLKKIFLAWENINYRDKSSILPSIILSSKIPKPILVHAEEEKVEDVINVVRKMKIPTHFCHISLASELKMIINAKEQGMPITCGVTPHHLFLTDHDAKVLGPFGQMKPSLSSKKDQDFLWKNLRYIDVIESDHAPHTIEEKTKGVARVKGFPTPRTRSARSETSGAVAGMKPETGPRLLRAAGPAPFGVPGLETTLPLLLTAVSEKRLTIDDIIRLCCENPSRIFCSSKNCDAKIEIDIHKSYIINRKSLFTKCGWSPFAGWKVKGKVKRVFIRSKKVFENDRILVKPGFGNII